MKKQITLLLLLPVLFFSCGHVQPVQTVKQPDFQDNNALTLETHVQMLIYAGYILTNDGVIQKGYIAIDNGKIFSIGTEIPPGISADIILDATSYILSPGFINCHDHISYNQMFPPEQVQLEYAETNPRYDQRHDWRKGNRGHEMIPSYSDTAFSKVAWNELRQLISGTITVVSKGGIQGLIRNLGNEKQDSGDLDSRREGLNSTKVIYQTFPLGDYDGQQYANGIHYPAHPTPEDVEDAIYVAHLCEGVDQVARNEFMNVSTNKTETFEGKEYQSYDILGPNLMLIHLIALSRDDVALSASKDVSIVWSPRSNISLYGNTSYVPLHKNLGMNICLSTDWSCSGSMNMLRELNLACNLNENYFDNTFNNKELWQMVTTNAAKALQISDQVGDIKHGFLADLIAVKIYEISDPYRTTIKSPIEEIGLVIRGGKILYGDKTLISGVTQNPSGEWDELEVNGLSKLVDTKSEIGMTYTELKQHNINNYPLFFDGTPPDEPKDKPVRKFNPQCPGVGIYPIFSKDEDFDQDGVIDAEDNEPRIFNPIRPVDVINGQGQCPLKGGRKKEGHILNNNYSNPKLNI